MIDTLYEQLNLIERERFQKIVNQLLGKTFIVNNVFDENKSTSVMNPDYRFIERNLELFRSYLELGGWKLERNDNYEVIYITSQFGYNKMHFDKFTTIILYILRLMYDQKRENINLTEHVVVKVNEVISTLNEIGAYDKKRPSLIEIKTALRTIARFNIIQKIDGVYENPETNLIILPSILFAINAESIAKINENIRESKDETEEEIEEMEEEELETEDVDENKINTEI